MARSVLWFRRDLRLSDHPALLAAADAGEVVPLFVIDPRLWDPAGPPRRAWLLRSLRALDGDLQGRLVIRTGDPRHVVPGLAAEADARTVHVTADCGPYGPYGRERDGDVGSGARTAGAGPGADRDALRRRPGQRHQRLRRAVPGVHPVLAGLGGARLAGPRADPPTVTACPGHRLRAAAGRAGPGGRRLPDAGEAAARARWGHFLHDGLARYHDRRDRPGVEGTSALSAHLKFGEIHPRTLLADLGRHHGAGADTFRTELAWREFYADVLWHRPDSAREYLRAEYARRRYDDPARSRPAAEHLAAGQQGRTG